MWCVGGIARKLHATLEVMGSNPTDRARACRGPPRDTPDIFYFCKKILQNHLVPGLIPQSYQPG